MESRFGRSTQSPFRRLQLLERLRSIAPGLTTLHERAVFLMAVARSSTDDERALLDTLLDYGDGEAGEIPIDVLVMPRPGTRSPWSTKATEILHRCGLHHVSRVELAIAYQLEGANAADLHVVAPMLHDAMTQTAVFELRRAAALFDAPPTRSLRLIPLHADGDDAIRRANQDLGLALSDEEVRYLCRRYQELGRDPTDVELMMFAQANSEHCRHKIFNASFVLDGEQQARSLFGMIRNTHARHPGRVLSAYRDNAAVMRGTTAGRFFPMSGTYTCVREPVHLLMKVETHNHPTAISPDPGAATGNGGEIRDEGATGLGAKPKAGLSGFSVSNLNIPGHRRPWERAPLAPARIASPLQIMLEGPIGGAAYNNEFGRPNLCGYFRTLEIDLGRPEAPDVRGYHKPIMIAGGYGNIREPHVQKPGFGPGAALVVLGGPAMLIGLGGGAASSVSAGASSQDLDFASVQRANPELQRRCQELIDRCWALGEDNPILSIHDVGAGGLSNALPEIVHDADLGAILDLPSIPTDDPSLSPLELWCNESQERYVLALDPKKLEVFDALARRERAPYAVLGHATAERHLRLGDTPGKPTPIDLPMDVLFGSTPRLIRDALRVRPVHLPFPRDVDLADTADRILSLPAVASKSFLITIGDRSITGMVARDQMVGPWQVPVADVAVTTATFDTVAGEAMAMGERAPVALLDAAASARMAVGEALTNLAAAAIDTLSDVALSANWMAAAGEPGQDAALFEAVEAVGMELCPALGICIPVGKDSLSMRTTWSDRDGSHRVVSPLSLIISAFAPTSDATATSTPVLQRVPSRLVLIDLGCGKNRLGGSALAQVYRATGEITPDVDDPSMLARAFAAIQDLRRSGDLLAYHDRSDGGLFVTACEMAFAGRMGMRLDLDALGADALSILFAEELGALLQVPADRTDQVVTELRARGLHAFDVGQPTSERTLVFHHRGTVVLSGDAVAWQRRWTETSYLLQSMRDDPDCAQQEYDALLDLDDPGLQTVTTFEPTSYVSTARPKVAILREQGVNGHLEMAAAFDRAGFEALDVTMSDLVEGRDRLRDCVGIAACGGFSFGDTLGAGGGWAKSILFTPALRDAFESFFHRADTFTLGVCNGCQMVSRLAPLIPGAASWPTFVRNRSEQFEARVCTLRIERSASVLLDGMEGSRLPVAVAHGEGRASAIPLDPHQVPARYVDNHGVETMRYPLNPNGSPGAIAGICSADGRVTLLMPHPERVFRQESCTWAPGSRGDAPWMQLFHNARRFTSG